MSTSIPTTSIIIYKVTPLVVVLPLVFVSETIFVLSTHLAPVDSTLVLLT